MSDTVYLVTVSKTKSKTKHDDRKGLILLIYYNCNSYVHNTCTLEYFALDTKMPRVTWFHTKLNYAQVSNGF